MSKTRQICAAPGETASLPLDDGQPMRFEALQVSLAIIYIQATGRITEDTPAEFDRFLASHDAKLSRNLHMHSNGGNLLAGLELGEKIRNAGYNTFIGRSIALDDAFDVFDYRTAICASACAYAFLGGVTRDFDANDVYGVHRFGLPGKGVNGDQAQVISSRIASYVQRMGVDQALLLVASATRFEDELFEVPVALAKKMRVIFDPSGQTSFAVEMHDGKTLAMFKVVMREREWQGFISCSGPRRFVSIIDNQGTIPRGFRSARGFPADFKDGAGNSLSATASYARVGASGGRLSFEINGLQATSFEGSGLQLDYLWNPDLDRKTKGKSDADFFEAKVRWQDQVLSFLFTIAADNAAKTLPIVFNQCLNQK